MSSSKAKLQKSQLWVTYNLLAAFFFLSCCLALTSISTTQVLRSEERAVRRVPGRMKLKLDDLLIPHGGKSWGYDRDCEAHPSVIDSCWMG
jgi:hypothetical protein